MFVLHRDFAGTNLQRLSEGPLPHYRTDGRAVVGGCLRKLQPQKFAWINKGWFRRITLARRA